jgi:predicted  nucleic acid-binding Zn-ribbon protein
MSSALGSFSWRAAVERSMANAEESAMPKRAHILYALQRIDNQIARRRRRYRQVQERLGQDTALREARAALQDAEGELKTRRGELRAHELETAGVTRKLQDTERQLYGGRITNPKELEDLQKEGEYLKRRRAALEETQLEEMAVVERLSAAAGAAQERHAVVEAQWRAENAELSAEYDTLRQELGGLLAKRKSLIQHVSENDMAEYDALRRLRSGVAVVLVRDAVCQVCHVEVPMHDLKGARDTDDFYYCSGCERIMYVPEG